jgi:predicted transcriptional regulator
MGTRTIKVSDESLAKILRLIQAGRDVTINQIIAETDFSDNYISVAVRELREMGCVVGARSGVNSNKILLNSTHHNCYYCKG